MFCGGGVFVLMETPQSAACKKGTGSELSAGCIMLKWKKKIRKRYFQRSHSHTAQPFFKRRLFLLFLMCSLWEQCLCDASKWRKQSRDGSRVRLHCSPVGRLQSCLPPVFLFYVQNITFSLSQVVFLRRSMPNMVQGPWGVTEDRGCSFLFWCIWRRCLK